MVLKVVRGFVSFNGSIYVVTKGKISRWTLVSNLTETIKIKYHLADLQCNSFHLIAFSGGRVGRRVTINL